MHPDYVTENLGAVRAALAEAKSASAYGKEPCLVAAVKYADDAELAELLRCGVTDVGENRVQQLLAHEPFYRDGVRVHFIGSLQKNKVKYLIGKVAMIHSVDSAELAGEIEKQAAKHGVKIDVLIEINSGREESKSGVLPEDAEALARAVRALPHLTLRGFMTMGPRCEDEEAYRRYFGGTRELARAVWKAVGADGEPLLSMGMSESFTAAIKEGADLVRVGRVLFRGRPTNE